MVVVGPGSRVVSHAVPVGGRYAQLGPTTRRVEPVGVGVCVPTLPDPSVVFLPSSEGPCVRASQWVESEVPGTADRPGP